MGSDGWSQGCRPSRPRVSREPRRPVRRTFSFIEASFLVTLGLGANPAVRAPLPANGKKLGTLSAGRFGHSGLRVVAEIAAYESRVNPDKGVVDSNPVALLGGERKTYVVDAGGNSLLSVPWHGRISTRAVFGKTQVLAPPFLKLPPGTKIPMEAVPTAAAYGPDGAIYVSQLTGFPFPVGAASIGGWSPARLPRSTPPA